MNKYTNINHIQNKITSDESIHLTYHASDVHDIIHPYSVPDYECLSGEFVGFLERFRSIAPRKVPIVLEIAGMKFHESQKKMIDNAIWTHFGLYLSEADIELKKKRTRLILFLFLMVLSSCLLFIVKGSPEEVVTNYGYLLFWFFAYRLFTYLLLDYIPIYREYQWYRHLASLKLVFSDDAAIPIDSKQLSLETDRYEHVADFKTKKNHFVNQILMEGSCIALGCRIQQPEDILRPSGLDDIEIVSDEMADYLLDSLPFIKQKYITKLDIEGDHFTDDTQKRISDAIRNHLAFLICEEDAKQKENRNTSILFSIGLLVSTILLYGWGKSVDVAIHELILVSFWFFADYLLEFILLSRSEINTRKKALEQIENMDISFKNR